MNVYVNFVKNSKFRAMAFTLVLALFFTMVPMVPQLAVKAEAATADNTVYYKEINGVTSLLASGASIVLKGVSGTSGTSNTAIYVRQADGSEVLASIAAIDVSDTTEVASAAVIEAANSSGNGVDLQQFAIYGGTVGSSITTSTSVTVTGGAVVVGVYGGGYDSAVSGSTTVVVDGSAVVVVCGGGVSGAVSGNTTVVVDGSTVDYVYGGGSDATATVGEGTSVTVKNSSDVYYDVYGGGGHGAVSGSTTVVVDGSKAKNVYGGGANATATVGADTSVTVKNSSNVYYGVYGGGNQGAVSGSATVVVDGSTVGGPAGGDVYGGGKEATATVGANTSVTVKNSSKVHYCVYGGGGSGAVSGSAAVVVDGSEVHTRVCGGGSAATATVGADTSVMVKNNSRVGDVYGGGGSGAVSGSATVAVDGSIVVNDVFGGGSATTATVASNTAVTVRNGSDVFGKLYGGGNRGAVSGSAIVVVDGSTVKYVYGGGVEASATVSGASVTINSGTVWGTVDVETNITGTTKPAVIKGGSVKSVSSSAYVGPSNATIYKVELGLANDSTTVANNITVTAISGVGSYGVSGIKTDGKGKIYLYLPINTSISEITADGKVYKFASPVGVDGSGNVTEGTALNSGEDAGSSGGGSSSSGGGSSSTASTDIKVNASTKGDTATGQVKSEELKKADTITIKSDLGNISFDSKATDSIQSQAGDNDITAKITKLDKDSLDNDIKKAVGDNPVYEFSLKAGDKNISSFGKGKVSITLPYELLEGQKENFINAYFVDENGKLFKMSDIKYNAKDKTVTFTATHFSKYMVAYEDGTAKWVNPFTDVKANAWYYGAVEYAVTKGLFKGMDDTTFAPNGAMTRAMLVSTLYRQAGSPAQSKAADFADVKSGAWYADAVTWAVEKGIAKGVGTNEAGVANFAPNQNITRQDMITILYNYTKAQGKATTGDSTDIGNYNDAGAIAGYALPAMKWACSAGLIQGFEGNLNPKGTATRAEVASILMNYFK